LAAHRRAGRHTDAAEVVAVRVGPAPVAIALRDHFINESNLRAAFRWQSGDF
jgi:hypothetical protein